MSGVDTREVRFGEITLHTNGFNQEIYNLAVGDRNMPGLMGHTQNWRDGRLKHILKMILNEEEGLDLGVYERLQATNATELGEKDYEKIAQSLMEPQKKIDKNLAYEESRGFFEDFYNAMNYVQNLVSVGLHPMSKRSHSNLDIEAEGETEITSKKGRSYKVSIPDTIENGLCHGSNHRLDLLLPESERRSDMHNFVINHNWGPELSFETNYMRVISTDSSGVETEKREVGHYELILNGTDAEAYIDSADFLFKSFRIWWDTKYAKQLCLAIANELDVYFDKKESKQNI